MDEDPYFAYVSVKVQEGKPYTQSPLRQIREKLVNERGIMKKSGMTTQANALKIMVNSIYGAMAAIKLLADDLVSCMVTGYGRYHLNRAQHFYTKDENGIGATVLYGDTDSLFLKVSRSAGTGDELANRYKTNLRQDIPSTCYLKLAFENAFGVLVLIKKKTLYGYTRKTSQTVNALIQTADSENASQYSIEKLSLDYQKNERYQLYEKHVAHGYRVCNLSAYVPANNIRNRASGAIKQILLTNNSIRKKLMPKYKDIISKVIDEVQAEEPICNGNVTAEEPAFKRIKIEKKVNEDVFKEAEKCNLAVENSKIVAPLVGGLNEEENCINYENQEEEALNFLNMF
ncbi:uncharacterized protein [Procambarus clarkii]|uniref:uncharacterized protein n=1 Tax=Procambarus clarkii TaxID=6728 RepID=UPI003742B594